MKSKVLNALLIAFVLSLGWSTARSAQAPYPANATFTTLITTPLAIEGLTGDKSGNLYTVGRNAGAGVSVPRLENQYSQPFARGGWQYPHHQCYRSVRSIRTGVQCRRRHFRCRRR